MSLSYKWKPKLNFPLSPLSFQQRNTQKEAALWRKATGLSIQPDPWAFAQASAWTGKLPTPTTNRNIIPQGPCWDQTKHLQRRAEYPALCSPSPCDPGNVDSRQIREKGAPSCTSALQPWTSDDIWLNCSTHSWWSADRYWLTYMFTQKQGFG